jgi:hypothetical protein
MRALVVSAVDDGRRLREAMYSSIAAVARAWGFSNPSFFSSRFREASLSLFLQPWVDNPPPLV